MKIILGLVMVLVGLGALLATGCSSIQAAFGDGLILDEQYDYKNFTSVEISSAFEYDIQQANYYSVVGTTSQNLIDKLDISQSGQKLIVTLIPGTYNNANFKVTITIPILNTLAVSGASHGSVTGFESANDFDLSVNGASGCDLEGSAGKATIRVLGASHVEAADFQTQDVDVSVLGASTATIYTRGTLNANVSGVSTLNYHGNPVLGTVNIDGLSNINRK